MQVPTTAELRTAIRVLKALGEQINEHAAHSVMQMPDTRLGDDYAAKIEARSIEQISRIEGVTTQLEHWRDELMQQQQTISQHV